MQQVGRQGHQAVRFFHIGGHLGQVPVGRQANRAAKRRSGLAANRGFDLARQLERRQQRLLPAQKPASHLVDGHDRSDGKARFDRFHYPMVVVHVQLMPGLYQHDAGAEPLGLTDLGSGAHSVLLGLVTGGDTTGCVRQQRHHGHGAVA